MTKISKGELKHDEGVEGIVRRLHLSDAHYDSIAPKYEYEFQNKTYEIDVVACLGDDIIVFEYKTHDLSKKRIKAMQQLQTAKKYLSRFRDASYIKTFYVHDEITYDHTGLTYEWATESDEE